MCSSGPRTAILSAEGQQLFGMVCVLQAVSGLHVRSSLRPSHCTLHHRRKQATAAAPTLCFVSLAVGKQEVS